VPDTHSFSLRAGWRKLPGTAARLLLVSFLFLAAFNPAPPPRNTVVAFGDSLTAGYGLRPRESFPAVLHRRLREDGYDTESG
jgi:acyl-CoA thioesterase I